jgi:hypothetical protein
MPPGPNAEHYQANVHGLAGRVYLSAAEGPVLSFSPRQARELARELLNAARHAEIVAHAASTADEAGL